MIFSFKRGVNWLRWRAKQVASLAVGWATVLLLRLVRFFDRKRTADLTAGILRRIGPRLHEHKIGRANLAAAFPEKPADEIERILAGVWDNLGRVAAEFAHLDRITISPADNPEAMDIVYNPVAAARIEEIRRSGEPRVVFAAHLANWELPALVAHRWGIDSSVLYRQPNIRPVGDAILKIRAGCMGTLIPSGFAAPMQLARTLERGGSIGMLVDQHDARGVDVTFFGRSCKASSLAAQLARLLDCPIQGLRIVRRPDGNSFWGELTEPLALPRDAEGKPDIARTTQAITSVIEGWVREHPEQWLWLHRRWR